MKRCTLAPLLAAFTAAALLWPAPAGAWTALDRCGPAWPTSDLPVGYRVNEDGVSTLSLDDVRTIFGDSFDAWSGPCCSRFQAVDEGLTSATAENQRDSVFAVSFIEDSWPRYLGGVNETLGVTIPLIDNGCNLVSADVVFNGVGFNFIDGSPRRGSDADLQSIATHEFGHFLGLGHSSVFEATMFAAYVGGIGARTLHNDDEDGVCTLYQTSCTCNSNADCFAQEDCIDGACQVPPCGGDGDCEAGLVCQFGDCVVPPCGSNSDCVPGQVCDNGACVPDANCPICATGCESNADCGSRGACIPEGIIGPDSVCTAWCNGPQDCPGDTDCFIIETADGDINLCFNSDVNQVGPCPPDFVCRDETNTDPCTGVSCSGGAVCNPSTGECQGGDPPPEGCVVCLGCDTVTSNCGPGTCLDFVEGPSVCSVPCNADGSCQGNSSCFEFPGVSGEMESWCLNPEAINEGVCAGGWECVDDVFTAPCDGVTCNEGESCNPDTGACEGGDTGGPDDGGDGDGGGQVDDGQGSGDGSRRGGDSNVGCGCRMRSGSTTAVLPWLLAIAVLAGSTRRRRRG